MGRKRLLAAVCFTLLLILLGFPGPGTATSEEQKIEVLFFWGVGCPHCETQKPYMEELVRNYPEVEVRSFEVVQDRTHRPFLAEVLEEHGITSLSVPITIIGDRHWIGFREERYPEMKAEVERLLGIDQVGPDRDDRVAVPFLGEIDISAMPLFLATGIISFVDGFNPCSLWLLTVLLGILLHTRSRKKIIIIGLTFLLTTAAGYGAFMLGLLNIFLYVGYLLWIKIAVGLMALAFAVVNIKDYFWFQEGPSLTISDKHKPGIYRGMRRIINPDMTTGGMIGATIIMALGVTLVELPCTAGFPVVWTNIVAGHDVGLVAYALLFALYLFIYLAVEIAILAAAVITLSKSVFQEKHGRILKLVGGVIMLALAYGIVFRYEALESIAGILQLFGASAIIIIGLLILHRVVLPRFGIVIGSEDLGEAGGKKPEI